MFRSLKAKHVHIAIAGLSAIVSFLILGPITTWVETYKCWEISVWKHVCLLQIAGGMFLFIGALKNNHLLFLPWLVAAIIFIYTLWYKSFVYFIFLEGKMLTVIPLLQIISAFWSYFVYDVFQDFLQMYGQSIRQNSIIESLETGN
ncbi:uncharacterized protein LOC108037797 [Drosophila rhopaloa]|uniref:Uncharacterized protein LOC108037797 n=1 Tax=Drosophila rhopaloa TaxID=1041015 RepID=A0A6P4DWA0_DRORH|nr:uncharacterized protein LOC108037797 [Drosophila rhopaloa]